MTENAILLIFGIIFIMAFFGLAAILSWVLSTFCPKVIEKIDYWIGIDDDADWEEYLW